MRFASAALALTLLLVSGAYASVPVAVAAADNPSEIPGVLWGGAPQRSSVGGSVFDRVWRLELPVGRIAVIEVAGDAGAELGLYLFDDTAITLLSADPLKSSARPGGSQNIVATLPTGTYYIDVNGRNTDAAYGFTISVSLVEDKTPPIATLRLKSGGLRISSVTPALQLQAYDSLSDVTVARMRLSGNPWGEWVTAVKDVSVTLPAIEGDYVVEAQVKNGVNLTSETASLRLTLDLTPPVATSTSPTQRAVLTTSRPTFSYAFSEAIKGASWSQGFKLTRSDGAAVPGTYAYNATKLTATFTPSSALIVGAAYVVRLDGVTDLAGNFVRSSATAAGVESWSFTYLRPVSITTAVASVPKVIFGSSVRLRSEVNGVPAGSMLQLERRVEGGAWEFVTSAFVRAGVVVAYDSPQSGYSYRFRFLGDSTSAPAASRVAAVAVLPVVRLSGERSYVRVRARGVTVALNGFADPAKATVSFVRYRCTSTYSSCTRVATTSAVTGDDGRATINWVATKGYWAFKLVAPAAGGLSTGSSGLLRIRVP